MSDSAFALRLSVSDPNNFAFVAAVVYSADKTFICDAAKEAYEKSTAETGKNSEQSKALKEELDKLEKEFTANETAIGKTETALANQTVKTEKSKTALMNMEAELKNVNDQLKDNKLEKFATACDTAGTKMESFGKKMSVVSAGIAGIGAASIADFVNPSRFYRSRSPHYR